MYCLCYRHEHRRDVLLLFKDLMCKAFKKKKKKYFGIVYNVYLRDVEYGHAE